MNSTKNLVLCALFAALIAIGTEVNSLHEERFLNIIKKAAIEAVEATLPPRVLFGKVSSTAPLTVRIDQKLSVSGDALVVTAGTRYIKDIQPGLQTGDKVVLLRMQGGQKYILLDKVVSA